MARAIIRVQTTTCTNVRRRFHRLYLAVRSPSSPLTIMTTLRYYQARKTTKFRTHRANEPQLRVASYRLRRDFCHANAEFAREFCNHLTRGEAISGGLIAPGTRRSRRRNTQSHALFVGLGAVHERVRRAQFRLGLHEVPPVDCTRESLRKIQRPNERRGACPVGNGL